MLSQTLRSYCAHCVRRHFRSTAVRLERWDDPDQFEHPVRRTFRIMKDDVVNLFRPNKDLKEKQRVARGIWPSHADIVIIGGGAIGSSVAYFLKDKTNREGISVVVIEKDPTYAQCSTSLSVGGLRQQFSLPENIQMSLFGADFIRNMQRKFGRDANVFFTPGGYLILADEANAQVLQENAKVQRDLGAINTLLSKRELKRRYPWMNVDDVEMGCLGLEKEGWFDPWSMLSVLREGAKGLGAQYIHGEVVDFVFKTRHDFGIDGVDVGQYEGINKVVVKLPNGEHRSIKFAMCVLAAGAESGDVARLARIGIGDGVLAVPLPVERRKRYVFRFETGGCEPIKEPALNAPMTIDYSGLYFRRDNLFGSYLCGMSPACPLDEPDTQNLDVDHMFFDKELWPLLAHRAPIFESLKVKSAWAGYYDYNVYDANGIVGPHAYYHNLYMATGFSGHGIQQAPAVGRAVAEMILDGDFQSINLTRLGFDRLIVDKPMYEVGIY